LHHDPLSELHRKTYPSQEYSFPEVLFAFSRPLIMVNQFSQEIVIGRHGLILPKSDRAWENLRKRPSEE